MPRKWPAVFVFVALELLFFLLLAVARALPEGGLMIALVAVLLAGGAVLFLRSTRQGKPGALRASASGLELDGARLVPQDEIADAYVLDADGSARLTIERTGGGPPIVLRVGSVGDAARVLDAVRLEPTHAALSLPTGLGSRVTIGDDGILVRRLWRQRFIPIGLVTKIETDDPALGPWERGRRLSLHLASGRTETLWISAGVSGGASYETDQLALLALGRTKRRIEEAMSRAQSRAAANADDALPPRGRRTVAAWMRQLRRLSRVASYRQPAGPPPEVLWRIIEDTSAAAASRAAAAVALGPGLDRRGRKRLEALASATVSPPLGRAFEAVGRKDDSQLAAALEELAPREQLA